MPAAEDDRPQRMEAMGALGIHLIGAPRIEVDRAEVPGSRGRTAWERLFSDTEDPLTALPAVFERAHASG